MINQWLIHNVLILFRPVTSHLSVTLGNRVVENVDLFFNLFDLLKDDQLLAITFMDDWLTF